METALLVLALVAVLGGIALVAWDSSRNPFWALWHLCWGTLGSLLNLAGAIWDGIWGSATDPQG